MESAVIDSCCLINLCATGRLEEMLSATDMTWKLSAAVARESLYLRRLDGAGNPEREPIDLKPHLASGLLEQVAPRNQAELDTYVALAAQLDDGEATCLAVCQHRGWWLASDDAKALRMANELTVRSTDTPRIIKTWADAGVEPAEISAALQAIEARARFLPRASHPLFAWWVRLSQRQRLW